jgi:hypothetical protein
MHAEVILVSVPEDYSMAETCSTHLIKLIKTNEIIYIGSFVDVPWFLK